MEYEIQQWMVFSGVINLLAYPMFINITDNDFKGVAVRIFVSIMAIILFIYGVYIFRNINREYYLTLLRHIRMVYPFTWRYIMRKKGRRVSPFTKSDFVRWWKCLLAHLSLPFVFYLAYDHGNLTKSLFIAGWFAFVIEAVTILQYKLKKPNPQG